MTPIRMEKVEAGMRAVLAFNDAFNWHDVGAMMALISGDCVFEDASSPPVGAIHTGKGAITGYWQDFFTKSPNTRIDVEEVFGIGNRCVRRWRCLRFDATGLEAQRRGVDVYQISDGLISEISSCGLGSNL